MSHLNHNTHDLSEAIKIFLAELPDPKTSIQSTILEDFFVEEEKVTLKAQKSKGMEGMIWNVGISTFPN